MKYHTGTQFRRFAAVCIAGSLIAAGCGGGNDRQALTDALVDDLMSEEDIPIDIDQGMAECIANAALDTVGDEQLEADGVTPDNVADYLTDIDDADVLNAIPACMDRDQTIAFISDVADITPEQSTCVVDELGETALEQILAQEPASIEAIISCLGDEG